MPSGFTLTEITMDDSQLRQLLGPTTSKRILTKYVRAINDLALLCQASYQSKVPIDTLELRNTKIEILKRATTTDPRAQIGIVYGTHYGRDKKPIGTIALADVLNLGLLNGRTLHRTQTSKAIAPFSSVGKGEPTAQWITKARRAFATARRTYLSVLR